MRVDDFAALYIYSIHESTYLFEARSILRDKTRHTHGMVFAYYAGNGMVWYRDSKQQAYAWVVLIIN